MLSACAGRGDTGGEGDMHSLGRGLYHPQERVSESGGGVRPHVIIVHTLANAWIGSLWLHQKKLCMRVFNTTVPQHTHGESGPGVGCGESTVVRPGQNGK